MNREITLLCGMYDKNKYTWSWPECEVKCSNNGSLRACVLVTMSVLWWCEGVSLSSKLHEASRSIAEQVCLIAFTCVMCLECFFDEYVQTHMQIKPYHFVHPAHCQSPGPLSSVGRWQLLEHPSQRPGLWRKRKENIWLEQEKKKEANSKSREGYTMTDSNMDRKKNRLNCKNKIDVTYEYTIIYVKFSSGIGWTINSSPMKKLIQRREQLQYTVFCDIMRQLFGN